MTEDDIQPGMRFGRWVVLAKAPKRRSHRYATCRCDCGTVRDVSLDSLIRQESNSRSCGCIQHAPALERFWRNVEIAENGCWLWTGTINQYGYAMFSDDNRQTLNAHRWAYLHFRGPIPEGLQIDHLCRIRHCVNPDHLEAVGVRENLLRGRRPNTHLRQMTHCPNGHLYSPENTVITEYGKRTCLTCKTEGDRRSAERLREKRRAQKAGT